MMGVYLLHFDRPFNGFQRHYIGYTGRTDPLIRLHEHRTIKNSASFTARVVRAGVHLDLAVWWPDAGEGFEQWLKKQNAKRKLKVQCWCPMCQVEALSVPNANGKLTYELFRNDPLEQPEVWGDEWPVTDMAYPFS